MAAYDPYTPLNVLKPFAPEVWVVDGPALQFGAGPLKLPFPTRMTVVRLAADTLWLHSPTAPVPGLLRALRLKGTVRYLVAPNSLHWHWLAAWQQHFPRALAYGVGPQRAGVVRLSAASPVPECWGGTLRGLVIDNGLRFSEAVFLHVASDTLVLTDLIENFEPARMHGWLGQTLLRMGGVVHPDGRPPLDLRLSLLLRRRAVRHAVLELISWGPERLILAHGRCYGAGARAQLERAFRFVL
jgi:hypothetical protein